MLKRSRDAYDSPGSSPPSHTSKRPFIRAAPPLSPTAQPTSCIGLNTTPYRSAFSVRAPLGTPLDSPGNPFGLERTLAALQLPQPTGIPKHYVLRFQLVRDMERPSLKRQRGGVYRVVRVPRNYTFRHLHKLILFLFASDAHDKLSPPNSSNDKGKGRVYHYSNTWWQGHKFEVQKRVTMHKYSTQVGVIQHGKTVKKLSSVRERKLLRKLLMPQDADGAAQFEESDAEKEMDSWTWEGEDDLTLAQVWSKGFSADRGIIYTHCRGVQVHITVNTLEVPPPRRGLSSSPSVLLAQGTAGGSIKVAHTYLNDDGDETVPVADLTAQSEPTSKLDIARWNAHKAFANFLRREGDREQGILRRCLPDDPIPEDSEPDLHLSSSPPCLPLSEPESEPVSELDLYSDFSLSSSYYYSDPMPFPALTPYPENPLRRRRVERAERRMERLTRSGMSHVERRSDRKKGKTRKKIKPALNWRSLQISESSDNDSSKSRKEDPAEDEQDDPLGGLLEEKPFSGQNWDPLGDEVEV